MHTFYLALAVGLVLPTATLAATLNVNSTADQLIAGNGQCTLREAVINANGDSDTTAGDCAAGSGADLINVPAGTYTLVIHLDITSDLTLRGAGAAITALVQDSSDTVVAVGSGNVVIERLSVRIRTPTGLRRPITPGDDQSRGETLGRTGSEDRRRQVVGRQRSLPKSCVFSRRTSLGEGSVEGAVADAVHALGFARERPPLRHCLGLGPDP
jgi:CSLREA domain-containing protein